MVAITDKISRILKIFLVRIGPLGLLVLLVHSTDVSCLSGPVTAKASIDTSAYLIGDWIDVEVRLEHPEGTSFTSLTGDTLGPLLVLKRDPVHRLSTEESVAGFRIAAYDTGQVTVPPFRFIYSLPGDSTLKEIETSPIDLVIHSIPVDTTRDIKDIKQPVSLALTWKEMVTPVGIVIAIIVAAWLLFRYLKVRGRRKRTPVEVIETRPPHIVAKERLDIIEEKRLWQQGLIKPYHSEVTEVIRGYLDGRYGIQALELTTDEILDDIESIDMPSGTRSDLESMLNLADLVKFARYKPLPDENTDTLRLAFSVVENTAEVADERADQEDQEVRVNVSE